MRLLDCVQQTPEWFAARRGVPTASEFNRIITKTGKLSASADEYIGELIDEIVHPESADGFAGNHHTERGNELEPKARAWYRFVTGFDVREVGLVLRDDGKAGCSPDSLIYASEECQHGLEIKAPEGKKHVRWMLGGKLPDEHCQQVHGSMAVTGCARWDFLSYCPGYQPFLVTVERDDYTDAVAAALDAFVKRLASAKAELIEYLPEAA